MIEDIKALYKVLKDKIGFCNEHAEKYNKKPISLYTNWFSGFWHIPEENQAEVLELLKEAVNKQKESQLT